MSRVLRHLAVTLFALVGVVALVAVMLAVVMAAVVFGSALGVAP